MRKRRRDSLSILMSLFILFSILGVGAKAYAAEFYSGSSAPLELQLDTSTNNNVSLTDTQKKLSSDLLQLIDEQLLPPGETEDSLKATMQKLNQFQPADTFVNGIGSAPGDVVYVYVSVQPTASTNIIDTYAWKVTDRDEQDHLAVAWVQTANLEVLASLNAVLHIVTVMPPVLQTGSTYSDLPISFWAYDAVSYLSSLGTITGYPNGTFRPDSEITKGEFISILSKALKLPAYHPPSPDFSDVLPTDWYYGSVESAVYAGVVHGNGNNTFAPDNPITREELASVLVQALGKQDEARASMDDKTGFIDDGSIASWARGFMAVAVKNGLIKGYRDNSIRPQENATRAEACVTIMNFMNLHN